MQLTTDTDIDTAPVDAHTTVYLVGMDNLAARGTPIVRRSYLTFEEARAAMPRVIDSTAPYVDHEGLDVGPLLEVAEALPSQPPSPAQPWVRAAYRWLFWMAVYTKPTSGGEAG